VQLSLTVNPQNDASPQLLERSLPGAWIAQHRRIWQMNLLNVGELAEFSHDHGLSFSSFEHDIIQLWQLGLLKADLIESRRKFKRSGLVARGINRNRKHVYSDERQLRQRPNGWDRPVNTARSLPSGVKLLFHPFRYYVLYHLNRALGFNSSPMQMFNQEGFTHIVEFNVSRFNYWTGSDQFLSSIRTWNDTASLCIITEPCMYNRIFHSIRYSPSDVTNSQGGAEEIFHHIDEYWNIVNELYHRIGMERLEQIRQDLCIDTQSLDSNRWLHTLVCLGDSKLRIESKDQLGGALILRTMAEMLRRATERAFDEELREEDELGFGWVPKNVKETIYGSNRLLDDHRAAGAFARRHGLNYKPRVHIYVEGDTEYGALTSFFNSIGISLPIINLHGLIKQSKSMVTFFRDELRGDIQEQRYSMVMIDGAARDRENMRILESAARNNQTSQDDGIFGRFFLSKPDFEFENFDIEELERVLWNWVGGESPSHEDRELLHINVKDTTNASEFFKGVKRAALTLPRIYGYDKCEAWGAELMHYAWEHQLKGNGQRKIIEAIKLALYWERTIHLEPYETAIKTNMVDPKTGELIKRPASTIPVVEY
jgi:hypothetical protein